MTYQLITLSGGFGFVIINKNGDIVFRQEFDPAEQAFVVMTKERAEALAVSTLAEYISREDEVIQEPKTPDRIRIGQLEEESVSNMLALAEVYETSNMQNANREQEVIDTMLALTEAYGVIMKQQLAIEALTARLDALDFQGGV